MRAPMRGDNPFWGWRWATGGRAASGQYLNYGNETTVHRTTIIYLFEQRVCCTRAGVDGSAGTDLNYNGEFPHSSTYL
jgi:hypothetical protein